MSNPAKHLWFLQTGEDSTLIPLGDPGLMARWFIDHPDWSPELDDQGRMIGVCGPWCILRYDGLIQEWELAEGSVKAQHFLPKGEA